MVGSACLYGRNPINGLSESELGRLAGLAVSGRENVGEFEGRSVTTIVGFCIFTDNHRNKGIRDDGIISVYGVLVTVKRSDIDSI